MERKKSLKYLTSFIVISAMVAVITVRLCLLPNGTCEIITLKPFTAVNSLTSNSMVYSDQEAAQNAKKDEDVTLKSSRFHWTKNSKFKVSTANKQVAVLPKIKSYEISGSAKFANAVYNENVHKVKYGLRLNAICPPKKDIYIVTVVESAPGGIADRQQFRETWGSVKEAGGRNIHTIFILGAAPNSSIQSIVEKESERYGDIVQYDFVDAYRNLTVKTVTALRWVLQFCPHAEVMMKTDADVIVQYSLLVDFLQSWATKSSTNILYTGCVLKHMPPVRSTWSKWYVSEEEYSGGRYPDYVAGWGYLLSLRVARSVLQAAVQLPYHPMEDVFVGMAAEKAGITPSQNKWFAPLVSMGYSFCNFKPFLVIHLPGNRFMRLQFWLDLKYFNNESCDHVARDKVPEHVCRLP